MSKQTFQFAKISATPTLSSWGQAYNAGGLFAVIALSQIGQEETGLNLLGKDFINNLEAEFFTLEEKTLASIKQALVATVEKLPAHIASDIVLGYIVDDILYVFIVGKGRVFMKRGGNEGALLESDSLEKDVKSASGILQEGDLLLLQTGQFTSLISTQEVSEALTQQTTDEIAEALSPKIHGAQEGGAAAIILLFTKPMENADTTPVSPSDFEDADESGSEETPQPVPLQKAPGAQLESFPQTLDGLPKTSPLLKIVQSFLARLPLASLPHSKKMFLSIAVILIAVLIGSIFVTKSNQESQGSKKLFAQVYAEADRAYQEGEGLLSLNASLAQDNFLKAKEILEKNKNSFKKGSEEEKKALSLLARVEKQLSGASDAEPVSPTKASSSDVPLLAVALEQKTAYVASGDKGMFFATGKGIYQVSSDEKPAIQIENDNNWDKLAGFGLFGSNFYILDTNKGILKFVATEEGFSETNYLDSDVSMAEAVDMAIDGSVWVALTNGTILKFTKGTKDTFTPVGMTTPFAKIKSIYTDPDSDYLYVLDPSQKRIVRLGKDGTQNAQFISSELSGAEKINVSEKEKAIYFLSKDTIWKISLP